MNANSIAGRGVNTVIESVTFLLIRESDSLPEKAKIRE